MSDKAARTNPRMIVDVLASHPRIFDRNPEFATLVHDLVVNQLENGPKVNEDDGWKHVGEHFKNILPVLMRDPQVEQWLPTLRDEYARLPATQDTRLREHAGDHSAWLVAGAAALLAGTAAAAIIHYCLAEVHPEPGTSAPVPHC